jgi:ribosomal protein L44E
MALAGNAESASVFDTNRRQMAVNGIGQWNDTGNPTMNVVNKPKRRGYLVYQCNLCGYQHRTSTVSNIDLQLSLAMTGSRAVLADVLRDESEAT